jgi:hypothetical protein
LWRRGLFSRRTNSKEILGRNPKEHVSIAMNWNITPKIVQSPKWGMGAIS